MEQHTNSSEHLNLTDRLYAIEPEKFDELDSDYIHTTRIIVKKGDKVLLCENGNANKHSTKNGKHEFPGGKIFDTLDALLSIQDENLDTDKKHKYYKESALRELQEETGIFISPYRLQELGTYERKIEEKNKKEINELISKKTGIRTKVYFVELGADEYVGTELNNWPHNEHFTSSDDGHSNVSWESTDLLKMMDDSLFARNSLIPADSIITMNSLLDEQSEERIEKLRFIFTNGISGIIHSENGEAYNKEVPGGQSISLVDISTNLFTEFNLSTFKEKYFQFFNSKIDKEEISNFKKIFTKYVIHDLLTTLNKYTDIEEDSLLRINNNLIDGIHEINDAKSLQYFFNKAIGTQIGDIILQQYISYRNLQSLPYFPYISGIKKGGEYSVFENSIKKGLGVDKKNTFKDHNGNSVDVDISGNQKTLPRMAKKLTTKPEIEPEKIKDVYRMRFILSDYDNIEEYNRAINALKIKLRQQFPIYNLEEKTEYENIARDPDRKELKLLGKFPVPGDEDVKIPIEIQIMTRSEYMKSEAGPKHHLVYRELQNAIHFTRGNKSIPGHKLDNIVIDLVNDTDVSRGYEGKKGKEKLKKAIMARFGQYFFRKETESGKEYYGYQHVIRNRGVADITKNQDELFLAMTNRLNQLIKGEKNKHHSTLTTDDYNTIFQAGKISNTQAEEIMKKVSNNKKFFKNMGSTKFGIDISDNLRILADSIGFHLNN